ncbi:bifunctional folylpolyglutamate synthase/dihydrofolate synthase [Parablautia intestinalis]|uniref:bifunctional folylpolyglutamate synthase/dihydrofolate synthase n=1 Tax=Parablautia intestinalis TaxID=2320100 RepID=UPI00256F3728|nr:hypothetical protein [Parablautia intestinalis]
MQQTDKLMTFQEAVEYLEELKAKERNKERGFGADFLCEKSGYPQKELSFIQITGSNGKSSVLAFLSGVLKACGYRTGSYISPALFEQREKIQINGRPISKKEYCRQITRLREMCRDLEREGKSAPTVYALERAMAFQYFKEQGCQIVVWETSLNEWAEDDKRIPNVLVYVFTCTGLEHKGILEKGLRKEGKDKEDIQDRIAVAAKSRPEVMELLQKRMEDLNIPLFAADLSKVSGIRRNLKRQIFSCQEYENLTTSLLGTWQVENGALAIAALKQLKEKGFDIPEKAVYKGFAAAAVPCRFQILAKRPYFIVDGTKDGEGAEKLAETLRFYFTGRRLIYIIGMLRDIRREKEGEPACAEENRPLAGSLLGACPPAEQVLTIPTKGEGGLSSYESACMVREYHDRVTAADSVEEAAELAYLLADRDTVIVAFGCLCDMGDFIRYVEKKNGNNIVNAPAGRK